MKAIYAGVVCLFAWGSAQGACISSMPPGDPESRADFLIATVRSLEHFQSAYAQANALGNAQSDVDLLTPYDAASEDLDCASDAVAYLQSASDETMRTTSSGLQSSAALLQQLNAESKESVIAELNGDYAAEKPGHRAARLAALTKAYHSAWELLPPLATAAVLSTIEFESPDSTKLGRLAITSAQRALLNAELVSGFPRSASEQAPKDMSWPETAAFILYFGLNKKGWSTHEQPYRLRPSGSATESRP